MERCLYNGLEHPELTDFLKKREMKNCLNCEYKYPCTNYEEFTLEKLSKLENEINIERRTDEERIIKTRIKTGYYRTANL